MTDRSIEERLSGAFGADMTPRERAWVDERVRGALALGKSPRWRPRSRLTRTLLLAGALLVVAPAVFTVGAAILSTEAPYGSGDAAAYEAELEAAKAVTPIPPGATWPPYLEQAPDRSASYGTGLGKQMVENNAYCLWLGYWYTANERDDGEAIAIATDVLGQARDWTTFTDPLTTDAGLRAGTRATIDAALAGDAPPVLSQLELNCTGTWESGK